MFEAARSYNLVVCLGHALRSLCVNICILLSLVLLLHISCCFIAFCECVCALTRVYVCRMVANTSRANGAESGWDLVRECLLALVTQLNDGDALGIMEADADRPRELEVLSPMERKDTGALRGKIIQLAQAPRPQKASMLTVVMNSRRGVWSCECVNEVAEWLLCCLPVRVLVRVLSIVTDTLACSPRSVRGAATRERGAGGIGSHGTN